MQIKILAYLNNLVDLFLIFDTQIFFFQIHLLLNCLQYRVACDGKKYRNLKMKQTGGIVHYKIHASAPCEKHRLILLMGGQKRISFKQRFISLGSPSTLWTNCIIRDAPCSQRINSRHTQKYAQEYAQEIVIIKFIR